MGHSVHLFLRLRCKKADLHILLDVSTSVKVSRIKCYSYRLYKSDRCSRSHALSDSGTTLAVRCCSGHEGLHL